MNSLNSIRHTYRLTPGALIVGLLLVEGLLFLVDRLHWFSLGQHKGVAILIVLASLGLVLVLLATWAAAAVAFRWQMQFSMRSLLVLTLATVLACGWLAAEIAKAREQRTAVEAIYRLHGGVWFDYYHFHSLEEQQVGVKYTERPPAWAWLRKLLGDDFFASVTEVVFFPVYDDFPDHRAFEQSARRGDRDVKDREVTDAVFAKLSALPHLRSLDARNTAVRGEWLERLKGLTHLYLQDTKIDDAGLGHLGRLSDLQELDLAGTNVTDAGLKHLSGLTHLERLNLATKVTGKGLVHLQGLAQIRWLFLEETTSHGACWVRNTSGMTADVEAAESCPDQGHQRGSRASQRIDKSPLFYGLGSDGCYGKGRGRVAMCIPKAMSATRNP